MDGCRIERHLTTVLRFSCVIDLPIGLEVDHMPAPSFFEGEIDHTIEECAGG